MKKKTIWIIVAVIFVVAVVGPVVGLARSGYGFSGPFKDLAIKKIEKAYDPANRSGEIIFYGASNFRLWSSMEEDLSGFRVQNHGFGGSNDQDLINYADRLLYPYNPSVVVFQTGSNDYVAATGTDSEKIQFCMERKARMFDLFHEQLPDAHFVVMSGLLLSGRSEYTDMTLEVNRQLRDLCEEREYMTYVDAEALTFANGVADPTMFVEDGIHLTDEARVIWANEYIIPVLEEIAGQMGDRAENIRK